MEDNSYFLSLDDSLKFFRENPDCDKSQFKNAYWKTFSGNYIVRASDGSDFSSRFDRTQNELVCHAIPIGFSVKKKVQTSQTERESAFLEPADILRQQYENISEEAWILGCERYTEEDFLPAEICLALWKLGEKPEKITGWAYYSSASIGVTRVKNRIVPIKCRPLLDKSFKSNIVTISLYSEAYLKIEYPELAKITQYQMNRMDSGSLKVFLTKAIKNNDPYRKIIFDRAYGNNTKLIIFYTKDSIFTSSNELKEIINIVNTNEPLDFNYEQYMTDNGNRIVIDSNLDFIAMLQDLKAYLKITGGAKNERE